MRGIAPRLRPAIVLQPKRDFDLGIRRMPHLRDGGWRIVFADGKVVLLGHPSSTARIK